MNEQMFMEKLAEEVSKRKDDERLNKLLEWCKNTTVALKQCGGDAKIQEMHAATTASSLLAEIFNIELTGDIPTLPVFDTSAMTIFDDLFVSYTFKIDEKLGIISVIPKINYLMKHDPSKTPALKTLKLQLQDGHAKQV